MTDEEKYALAVQTLQKLTPKEQQKVVDVATTLSIKANLPFALGLVVILQIGQYFATHAGVKNA